MVSNSYVLDTHVWLWFLEGDKKLSLKARRCIEAQESELIISSISVWELLVAAEKGRIELLPDPEKCIDKYLKILVLREIPVSIRITKLSRSLNFSHEDPADRFIAATAYDTDSTLITADEKLLNLSWLNTIRA